MVSPNDLRGFNGIGTAKPVSLKFVLKFVLFCIAVVPATLLVLGGIFCVFFMVTHRWDYLFIHPAYLAATVGLVLAVLLGFLAVKGAKQGVSVLYADRPDQLAIIQKLNAIQDKEQRKEAARKILGDKILGQPWVSENIQQSIRSDQKNGRWILAALLYLTEYLKSAWQGKVQFLWLFLFGSLTTKALNFIAHVMPILTWPIVIFAIPYLVWWLVSAWRCAYNHSRGRWLGHLNRIVFIGLPIFGLVMVVFLYGLDMRQGVLVDLECQKDQMTYENVLAAKSDPQIVEQAKSILDACNVQKEICFKDLDACRRKVIP